MSFESGCVVRCKSDNKLGIVQSVTSIRGRNQLEVVWEFGDTTVVSPNNVWIVDLNEDDLDDNETDSTADGEDEDEDGDDGRVIDDAIPIPSSGRESYFLEEDSGEDFMSMGVIVSTQDYFLNNYRQTHIETNRNGYGPISSSEKRYY